MPRHFEMPYTFYGTGNCFFVNNFAKTKGYIQAKAALQQALQNLGLYLTHNLYPDFIEFFIPGNLQLRHLFCKQEQLGNHRSGITARREDNLIRKNGFQDRCMCFFLFPQPFPSFCLCKPGYRTDGTGFNLTFH